MCKQTMVHIWMDVNYLPKQSNCWRKTELSRFSLLPIPFIPHSHARTASSLILLHSTHVFFDFLFSPFFFSFSFLFCFLRIDPLCVSLNNIGWMRGWMIPHCRRVLCASSSNSVGREVTFSARALSPPTLRFCSRSLPCALLSPLSCTVSLRSWARAFSFPRYL